jgi:hypothetical protein
LHQHRAGRIERLDDDFEMPLDLRLAGWNQYEIDWPVQDVGGIVLLIAPRPLVLLRSRNAQTQRLQLGQDRLLGVHSDNELGGGYLVDFGATAPNAQHEE